MEKGGKTENLTPFQKGQSGNPNGRPKGSRNISTVLAEMLAATSPESVKDLNEIKQFVKRKKLTNADAVAARLLYEAIMKGELPAIKEVIDRTEGKPAQAVEVGGTLATYTMTKEEWERESAKKLGQVSEQLSKFDE